MQVSKTEVIGQYSSFQTDVLTDSVLNSEAMNTSTESNSVCVCEHSLFLTNMSTGVCLKTVLNWTKCRSARLTNCLRAVLTNRIALANK